MSNSPGTQPGGKLPKQMSSRLLTMKFMQRAAASGPNSPVTPSKSSLSRETPNSTPKEDATSSSKRLKLSHTPDMQGSAEVFTPTRPTDVKAALASAEATRQAALERSWRGEETKWAFAIQQDAAVPEAAFKVEILNGRRLDNEEDDDALDWRTEGIQGRKVFGKKKKEAAPEKHTNGEDKSDGSDISTDSEDSLDRQAEEILNMSDSRSSERALNIRPNRISGAVNRDRIQCHSCKEFGHMIRNCPNKDTRKYHQPIGVRPKG